MTKRHLLFRFVLIGLSVVAVAAAALVIWPVSPTVAVLSSTIMNPPGQGLPASFHIRQSTPLGQGLLVYYTFDQADRRGIPGDCEFVSYVRRKAIGWKMVESYGGCLPRQEEPPPFTAVSRVWDIPGEGLWSEVHGKATMPDTANLRIDWSDGQAHTASPLDGHYLIARPGREEVMQIEGLDRAGMVMSTYPQVTAP